MKYVEEEIREIKRKIEIFENDQRQKKLQSTFLIEKIHEKKIIITHDSAKLADLKLQKEKDTAELTELKAEINQNKGREITLQVSLKRNKAELIEIGNNLVGEQNKLRTCSSKINQLYSKRNNLEEKIRQENDQTILLREKIRSRELKRENLESKLSLLTRDIEIRIAKQTETVAEINQHNMRLQYLKIEIDSKIREVSVLQNSLQNKQSQLSDIMQKIASTKKDSENFSHNKLRKTF
jgi:chromosome segregation ATPase